ncbi:MAG: type IV pilus twitching motility protein PilT [candidate division WWE3 bacterium]|nr:type IV pilus twitching motility protein PilT [candidate division WWE3 bacterium]
MLLDSLLQKVVDLKASDLHLTVGSPPLVRIDSTLQSLPNLAPLTREDVYDASISAMSASQKSIYELNKEIDFSYSLPSNARFRINAFTQQGLPAAAIRYIPAIIPTIEELMLPQVLYDFGKLPQGLVLITGPTGQGKSTTLASIIDSINSTRACHIVTIEDPIEYVFTPKKALIAQREMYKDTLSWETALRSVLREDPEVVLVGEMRDFETIAAAITVAETGHLVLATLHTNSAAQSIDRMIDVFPENQQTQVRSQLASILEGVISQRLVPKIGGGRIAACEVLINNDAIRNLIREGKTFQINNVVATSYDLGMITLERSLASLVKKGTISIDEAIQHTLMPDEVRRLALG